MQTNQYLIRSALTFCADSFDIIMDSTDKGRFISIHKTKEEALAKLNIYTIKMWNDSILDSFDRFFSEEGLLKLYSKSKSLDEYDYDLIQTERSDDELLGYLDKIQLKLFEITEIPNTQDFYVYWNNYSSRYAIHPWTQDGQMVVSRTYDLLFSRNWNHTTDLEILGKNFNGDLKGTYEQLSNDPLGLENLVHKCEWLSYQVNSDGHHHISFYVELYHDTFNFSDFSTFNQLLKTPLYEIKKVSAQELCDLQCKRTGQLIPDFSLVI